MRFMLLFLQLLQDRWHELTECFVRVCWVPDVDGGQFGNGADKVFRLGRMSPYELSL